MKYYSYIEPDETDDAVAIKTVLSEDEILLAYWDYWTTQMRLVGRSDEISKRRCIEDFCTIHWATEEIVYKVNNQLFVVNEHKDLLLGSPYATLACLDGSNSTIDGFVDLTKLEIYDSIAKY